jgi:alpha 1,3-glucosidase
MNEIGDKTYAGFVSESGSLEFFVFASTANNGSFNRVKKVQQDLAIVTGFAPLPPINYLGFHFCKWDWVSSDRMIERNSNFTHYDVPVDVLWMDIEWADLNSDPEGYEYFFFNPQNFTTQGISDMNAALEESKRGMVVIVDPHIKAVDTYEVFSQG